MKENTDHKPPLPCGHTHSWERLRESTQRKNQESESLRQVKAIYGNDLATPAMSLEPKCIGSAFPLDYSSDMERGDLLHG